MNYQIITDEAALDDFIGTLPELEETEVYYLNLFARHKYCAEFPNHNSAGGQIVRFVARKSEIKEKISRLECPVGSFKRDGLVVPQAALGLYIGLNPRSLAKANRLLLVTLAKRIADGDMTFNPISAATTEIHRALSRKFFVDFDYDNAEPEDYLSRIKAVLPVEAFRILKTRGGFHLIVELAKIKIKTNWHQTLVALPNCDVRGSNTLTPVAGCYQGGFTPHFI